MTICINGETRTVVAGTVAELLRELQAPEHGVALALNGQVVRGNERCDALLTEGDVVELIHAVQGG